ncbi:MAG: hypothetical protein HY908_37695 [Myxococcales bacterium]|nr:hypothetical protein [Myxococcales bacterium]
MKLSKVLRVPVGGGTSVPLATNQSFVAGLAVDGAHLVWAERAYFATQGQIRTVAP